MHRRSPRHSRMLWRTIIGILLMLVAAAGFAVRYAPLPNHPWMIAAVAGPYLLLLAPLALALLLWARRWALGGLAAGLTVVVVAVQVPLYVADRAPQASATVRVMTVNMLYGRADAAAITAIADCRADVLMVQELTPEAFRRLENAGIDRVVPHRQVDPLPAAAGAGIFSRFPIVPSARLGGLQRVMVNARLRVAGVTPDPVVASIHLASPWPHPVDGWRRDLRLFPEILDELRTEAGDGSIIVGGDFNSTVDMRPFRRLLTNGYRDASEQAGEGRQFTYRSARIVPPFMGIDHVLTRNATAISTDTVTVPDTDHRALVATVLLPRN